MEIQKTIERLIDGLAKQHFSFNEELTNTDLVKGFNEGLESDNVVFRTLWRFGQKLTSYDDIDKTKFDADIKRAQDIVGDQMLIGWKYSLSSLIVVGVIHADDLTSAQVKDCFDNLDRATVDVLRKNVAKGYSNTKGAVYCTFVPIFADSDKVKAFKEKIRSCFKSHFWKQTYSSTMCVDCVGESMVMGRGIVGKWKAPGFEWKKLEKDIFG